ncbi:glycosyltransferase [Enterovibrio norvegicus]|uniref:glycosyltransferase n=1 Tax=Enterovibrio norvegicus TaxID=188144 RepID=UPI00352C3324
MIKKKLSAALYNLLNAKKIIYSDPFVGEEINGSGVDGNTLKPSLFCENYYLSHNSDVREAGVDPVEHYIKYGWKENRQPSPYFDVSYYLNQYPDVHESGVEPLSHFNEWGWKEGRNPNPNFNTSYYLEKNPDVKNAGINPLQHWLMHGKYEKRKCNVRYVDIRQHNVNSPTIIFVSHEASETGAPAVLLSLMQWIKDNTNINFSILVGASGPWNEKFINIAPTFFFDHPHTEQDIREFCGNNVQSIYINTIAAANYANSLSYLHAEFITHVHEMESVFEVFKDNVETLKNICNKFISVSPGSTSAIEKRFPNAEITYIRPFIQPYQKQVYIEKAQGKKIIFGCGAVEKRKGFDLFCQVALEIKQQGYTDIEMHWIGSDVGKDLNAAQTIQEFDVANIVKYLGSKENPRDYFSYGDLFLLTSREDPYPLVCMEAAEHQTPVICFDQQAGGMYSFVESDAGKVVEYLNTDAMASAAIELLIDKEQLKALGQRAKDKVAERHYVSSAVPKILELLPKAALVEGRSELEIYKAQIAQAKVISFDIFDTLIIRKVAKPETVFDVMELKHTQNETGIVSLFEERMKTAGKVLGSYRGKRDDISIDEIYSSMPVYRDANIEKDCEVDACEVNPIGYELYQYALDSGKPVYITSDMYLDKETIVRILNKNKYYQWDEFFLSSERGKKKDTGRLFKEVIAAAQQSDVKANDIVHIGDNWAGDVEWARKLGITAVRFNPIYESSVNKITIPDQVEAGLSQTGRIWNGYSKQATRTWAYQHPELANDFFIKLGMELSGPLAAQMAIHTKQLAEKEQVKKVVFMARDGRVIKKAFDKLYAKDIAQGKVESLYLSLSRATVIPATFSKKLSSNDLYFLIEGLHLAEKSIAFFIEKAGLDKENSQVIKVVNNYFESVDFVPNWNDFSKLSELFTELSGQIYAANAEAREGLKLYLEQHGILDTNAVIFVDVGWLLNIQSRLENFVKQQGSKTKVIGSYVGSRERINKSLNQASLLYSLGEPAHYAKFIDDNITLFELLFSAPEASASSISVANGKAQVNFKPLSMPLSKEYLVAQKLQMGAEYYFEHLVNDLGGFVPEQTSQDYVFELFKALVQTEDHLALAELTNFEVRLGGHHEFVTYQDLLRNDSFCDYAVKPVNEFFEPIHYDGEKESKQTLIITSAGLTNGSTRYRATNYAESLQVQGKNAVVFHAATAVEKFKSYLGKAERVIFQRCFTSQGNVGEFLKLAREYKLECIFEIDDLVFPEHVSSIGSVKGGEWDEREAMFVAKSYESFMLQTDRCIVSTPVLKEYIEKTYQLECEVIRNQVSPTKVREKLTNKGDLKLIYASGTFSHKEDFLLIEADLYQLLVDNPKISLSLLGATSASERILALPNVSCYPLLPYDAMLDFVAKHHVMLVPLVDNIFNHAKSNVKYIECQAVGVDVFASPVEEFKSVLGSNFLLDQNLSVKLLTYSHLF